MMFKSDCAVAQFNLSPKGKSSLFAVLCSVGQFIITQYMKLSDFIELIRTDLCNPVDEFLRYQANPKTISSSNSIEHSQKCLVIEAVIFVENCAQHCSEDQTCAFICEQWVFAQSEDDSAHDDAESLEHLQRAIEAYFKSCPTYFWLKEHSQTKRHKLTYRVCSVNEASAQVGVSFLTTASQLSDVTMAAGLAFGCPVHANANACCASADYARFMLQHVEHTFAPIRVCPNGLVQVTVVFPERMPSSALECPFCPPGRNRICSPPEVNRIVASPTACWRRSRTGFSESDTVDIQCAAKRAALTNPPSSVELPMESEVYKELLLSPMVVVTDAQPQFFDTESHSASVSDLSIFPIPSFDSLPNSATSTLTKKPRSSKPTEVSSRALDSPPRKQQRVGSADGTTLQWTQRDIPVHASLNRTRTGAMDEVIAEFTQLNMKRTQLVPKSHGQLSAGHTSSLLVPTKPAFELPTNVPVLVPEPRSSNCPDVRSTGKKRDHTPTTRTITASSTITRALSCRSNNRHWPRERRRNGTPTCLPTWSSALQPETSVVFNRRTGLPLQSSPIPLKRSMSGKFDFDSSLCSLKPSRSSACMLRACSHPTGDLLSKSEHPNIANSSNAELDTPPLPTGCSSNMQHRRRPTSLRLNTTASKMGNTNSLHSVFPAACRHHVRPSQVDQAEISCSAPPSGNRGSLNAHSHGRMINTLGCTPVSHTSSQHLLVNFEESMLNGRIHPVGQVDGFTLELGASGSFFPAHERIPLNTYFFDLSEDNKPSPYLGYADLSRLCNGKGYHLPMKGSVQLTLFNPSKFVVKMFVIGYDFEDMPPNSQTFLRQRTVYMPVQQRGAWSSVCNTTSAVDDDDETSRSQRDTSFYISDLFWSASRSTTLNEAGALGASSPASSCSCSSLSSLSSACSSSSLASNQTVNSTNSRVEQHVHLRYLVHLRFHTTRSGRLYLHTDLRLIFARDKFEFDPRVATYELRSFTDAPTNPRYSPKKWSNRSRTSARLAARVTTP